MGLACCPTIPSIRVGGIRMRLSIKYNNPLENPLYRNFVVYMRWLGAGRCCGKWKATLAGKHKKFSFRIHQRKSTALIIYCNKRKREIIVMNSFEFYHNFTIILTRRNPRFIINPRSSSSGFLHSFSGMMNTVFVGKCETEGNLAVCELLL